MDRSNQMSTADLEKMTDSDHHLGTDADGNNHYVAAGGLAWIADGDEVVFSQTVPSVSAYVDRVRSVTGWADVDDVSDQPFGAWLCDVVETASEADDQEASA